MTGTGKKRKESGDLRLGDTLLGLPCLQRQRANLTAGAREERAPAGVECPVCGIEVPELVQRNQGAGDAGLLQQVQEKFPGWQPEEGLCRPCLERFSHPR